MSALRAAPRPGGAPLRVLHLRNSDRMSGPERLLVEQCRRRAPDVVPVVAAFATRGRPPPALLAAAAATGVAVEALAQRHAYDRRVLRALDEAIARHAPQVLVGHDYKANWALARAARRHGLPAGAVLHGYTGEDLKVRLFEWLDRRRLARLDAVVCVSEAQRAALCARGLAAARVHLIPNAIDADAVAREAAAGREPTRRAWGIGPEERVVLALGRLSPEKGLAGLLEAFAALPAPAAARARLVLVGDGPLRAALGRRANAPDLAGRVRLAGWSADPLGCLGAADAFVLPSLREGLPLALLEALAAGLPTAASAVGGVPGALEGAGLLLPPKDRAAWTAALRRLLDPDAEIQALARTGPARVRERFGAERQVRALEALYRSLAREAT